jgi:hypothetical protein
LWNDAGLRDIIEPRLSIVNNVKKLLFDTCRNEPVTIVGTCAMIVWCLFQNRNNCVWNRIKDTTKDVASRATHMIGEWRAVNMVQRRNGVTDEAAAQAGVHDSTCVIAQPYQQNIAQLQWQKPLNGWWKCNVDASITQNSSSTC